MVIHWLPPIERVGGWLAEVTGYQRVGVFLPNGEIVWREGPPEFDLEATHVEEGVLIVEKALGVRVRVDDVFCLRIERGEEEGLDERVRQDVVFIVTEQFLAGIHLMPCLAEVVVFVADTDAGEDSALEDGGKCGLRQRNEWLQQNELADFERDVARAEDSHDAEDDVGTTRMADERQRGALFRSQTYDLLRQADSELIRIRLGLFRRVFSWPVLYFDGGFQKCFLEKRDEFGLALACGEAVDEIDRRDLAVLS